MYSRHNSTFLFSAFSFMLSSRWDGQLPYIRHNILFTWCKKLVHHFCISPFLKPAWPSNVSDGRAPRVDAVWPPSRLYHPYPPPPPVKWIERIFTHKQINMVEKDTFATCLAASVICSASSCDMVEPHLERIC